jgi:hypothetical protein
MSELIDKPSILLGLAWLSDFRRIGGSAAISAEEAQKKYGGSFPRYTWCDDGMESMYGRDVQLLNVLCESFHIGSTVGR